jgi:hypothetical protein
MNTDSTQIDVVGSGCDLVYGLMSALAYSIEENILKL